jgi:hypothetical protein
VPQSGALKTGFTHLKVVVQGMVKINHLRLAQEEMVPLKEEAPAPADSLNQDWNEAQERMGVPNDVWAHPVGVAMLAWQEGTAASETRIKLN